MFFSYLTHTDNILLTPSVYTCYMTCKHSADTLWPKHPLSPAMLFTPLYYNSQHGLVKHIPFRGIQ